MIAAERETVITVSDDSERVLIYTAQRKFIHRLKKHPSFECIKEGEYEGSPWAEFTIPADRWNPASGAKRSRKPLTEQQKADLRARLARQVVRDQNA